MEDPGFVEPWLLATVLFLVLLGGGRTLRGRWLGRPPFGAGLAVSVALGVMLGSLGFALLGHLGALGSPWPQAMLALGMLLALPGLLWTWRDWRHPAPGLEGGYGLGWFGPAAWLLIVASLAISLVWITGAFGWEARGFLFERVGVDHELGRVVWDAALPRDPFLGIEPLALWLYALGSPEAGLGLAWWLGVAMLFGVCGLGCRLHARGAGLLAAMALSLVLFATDQPLFLAPALPAAVALLAVMILAVESRGRPNVAHSLVAGALGGFALVSDLGAAAMLLPLLFLGPLWCKYATGLELGQERRVDSPEPTEPPPEPEPDPSVLEGGYDLKLEVDYEGLDDDFIKFGEDEKSADGGKWRTPLKHTGLGAVGLSLPLVPWLARNDAWTDDPLYGFRDFDRIEYATRHRTDLSLGYELKVDYRFLDEEEQGEEPPVYEPYLDATEWGLGLGLASGVGLFYGDRRRRRQRLLYAAPAALGYGLGATLGDFDLTTPSSIGLLSVTAGSTLYTMRDCGPTGRNSVFGATLATGGLAVGLSGANDCGYWDERDLEDWTPSLQLEYRYYGDWKLDSGYRFNDDYDLDEYKLELRYDAPKLDLGLRYEFVEPEEEAPGTELPDVPLVDPRDTPAAEYRLPDEPEDAPAGAPDDAPAASPDDEPSGTPGPKQRPKVPTYRPDVRPDAHQQQTPRTVPRVRPGY
jgi:hypothetical protein